MENILSNLLADDNLTVQRATAELQEAFKQAEAVPALCQIVVSSPNPQHRQYAAVVLRKQCQKLRNWQLIAPDQQQIIKQGMLNAIVNEKEKPVRNAIAQFLGVLVKFETPENNVCMKEILNFIFTHCGAGDAERSELGSSLFAILTENASDQFLPQMEPICDMFSAALVATEAAGNMATVVVRNMITGMKNLFQNELVQNNHAYQLTYQKSIPYLCRALEHFAVHKPDEFEIIYDLIDYILEYVPKLLNPHVEVLVELLLKVACNNSIDKAVRVCVVSNVGYLIRQKKKAIIKQKLLSPIVQTIFSIMGEVCDDEQEEDDESDDEDEYFTGNERSLSTSANQTMDAIALSVPSEKLIPILLRLIEPALQNPDPYKKRAAYLTIAVIAEGCCETICAKYLQLMLNCIKTGIVDPNVQVRDAAFFALGQFSEYLQPDISKYADEILPILLQFLQQLSLELRSGNKMKHVNRMFYALETFCSNLEDALVPYLPVLMERLLEVLQPANSVHLRELSLSCIGCTANAVKIHMLPYFPKITEQLQLYLVRTDNEDIIKLRPHAIDTLAELARTIGKENFMPLSQNAMQFALNTLEDANDPELRSSLYNLIASLAEVVNAEMAPVLPKIIERMIETIQSSDAILPIFKEEEIVSKNDENDDRDIDIENTDDEDDDEYEGFDVENAFLDEKEEAITALKLLAEFTGPAFVPYITPCFENIYKMLDHPNEDIRSSALQAITQFIFSLNDNNDDVGVQNGIVIFVPKAAEIIKSDDECSVVISALASFEMLLKNLKQKVVFNEELKATIFESIQNVMTSKVACQLDDDQVDDDENEESENEILLVENAGNVLPKFGLALTPNEFALYFGRIVQILVSKLDKTKNVDGTDQLRSTVYGTLSECFEPLQSHTGAWFDVLLLPYLHGLQDSYDQVRQNSVFGLGELVLYSDEKAYDKFPIILQALSAAVSQEEHPGTLDNICGALARLILSNFKLIPLEQVLPVFVQNLPLREDFNENLSIFKSFLTLWTQQCEPLILVLDRVIMVGLHVLHKKEYVEEDTRNIILNLLKDIRNRFNDKFNEVANSNPEIANFVQTL